MKKFITILLFTVIISGALQAQDSGKDFFKSIDLVYTLSFDKTGDAIKSMTQSMGLTANLFIFSGEAVGYYINPGFGLRIGQKGKGPKSLEYIDTFFDITFGPAFRLYSGEETDILAGIGPDLSLTVQLRDWENDTFGSVKKSFGIGLGGGLETRLKLFNDIAFAGGILTKYNFAPNTEDRIFILSPYFGVGF